MPEEQKTVTYTYKGETVTFVEVIGCIDEGVPGWIDKDGEWGVVGATIKDVKAAFREAVSDC